MLHAQPIQLAYVLSAEVLEQVASHQLVAKGNENAFLHLLAADGKTVRAGAARARAEARQAVAPVHDVPGAALGAFRQAGEEILRASCLVEPLRIAARRHAAHLRLPRLHLFPQLVIHDSQFGNSGRHPLGWQIWSRDTLSCVRVLDVSQAIPHESPDVELVVQNSSSASRIAVNGAGIPGCAIRSRTPFCVQPLGQSLGRHAGCVVAENPADHCRLVRDDLAIARCSYAAASCARYLVAVAQPASRLPELHAAAQTSPCLVGKILQEGRVHRALQTDVQVCDVSLGKRDDVHASEGETLEQSGGVLLIPAESVQRLGEHNVELPIQRVMHHRLETSAQERCSRKSVVGELVDDRPTLSRGELPADA